MYDTKNKRDKTIADNITFLCKPYLLRFTANKPTSNRKETAELITALIFANT
jgi:hypothetical protein